MLQHNRLCSRDIYRYPQLPCAPVLGSKRIPCRLPSRHNCKQVPSPTPTCRYAHWEIPLQGISPHLSASAEGGSESPPSLCLQAAWRNLQERVPYSSASTERGTWPTVCTSTFAGMCGDIPLQGFTPVGTYKYREGTWLALPSPWLQACTRESIPPHCKRCMSASRAPCLHLKPQFRPPPLLRHVWISR